jgi:hypothetical protein
MQFTALRLKLRIMPDSDKMVLKPHFSGVVNNTALKGQP